MCRCMCVCVERVSVQCVCCAVACECVRENAFVTKTFLFFSACAFATHGLQRQIQTQKQTCAGRMRMERKHKEPTSHDKTTATKM
jgi:hypothetical protein